MIFYHSCIWWVNSSSPPELMIIKSTHICASTYLDRIYTLSRRGITLYEGQRKFTHWGRVTHICVSKLTINGSYNGLSPARRQAIIWTNAGILLIRPLGTNSREIVIEIYTLSFMKGELNISCGKWRPFCLGLSVLSSFIWPQFAITGSSSVITPSAQHAAHASFDLRLARRVT